jgi:hypothetical protein
LVIEYILTICLYCVIIHRNDGSTFLYASGYIELGPYHDHYFSVSVGLVTIHCMCALLVWMSCLTQGLQDEHLIFLSSQWASLFDFPWPSAPKIVSVSYTQKLLWEMRGIGDFINLQRQWWKLCFFSPIFVQSSFFWEEW